MDLEKRDCMWSTVGLPDPPNVPSFPGADGKLTRSLQSLGSLLTVLNPGMKEIRQGKKKRVCFFPPPNETVIKLFPSHPGPILLLSSPFCIFCTS
jgi:hypothetical protein